MSDNIDWKWFALGSAFFAGLTAILGKIGVQGIPSNLGTAIRTVVILVLSWALVFARGENATLPTISRTTWLFLILSGIATGLSWLCYFRALQVAEAKYVAPLDKLSLPLTIILATLLLKEKWTLNTTIGVVLVTIGTYVLTIPNDTSPSRPPAQTRTEDVPAPLASPTNTP